MQPAVILQGVEAGYYSQRVLHEIDLEVGSGFHVLLGPNGAGKTTLFRVIAGVLRPLRGTVRLFGQDPHRNPKVKRSVTYLTHRTGLYSGLKVLDNLLYWARVLGVSKSQVDRVIEEFKLERLISKSVSQLSRGQKQRVAIARALLADPELLLLDEPTTGMDPAHARHLRERLKQLAKAGQTLLYSTHNLYEAAELAEEVILLSRGRIIDRGPIAELQKRFTARRRLGLQVVPTGEVNPEEVFQNLGCSANYEDPYWILEFDLERDVGDIVSAVVSAGLRVLEVRELENPLESLYFELGGDEQDRDVD